MRAFLLPALLLLCAPVHAQQLHSRVRIPLDTPAGGLLRLAELGLAIDHAAVEPGTAITVELSAAEVATARANGFPVDVLIEDLQSYYRARSQEPAIDERGGTAPCDWPADAPDPAHWQLGSYGGFFTWQEMQDQLDSMRAAYPQLITAKSVIGTTHEGRPLHLVRLSNDADSDLDRPELLFTALHHAREPVGLSQLIYFLWHLLEGYGTDAEATYVLDHFELYAVPCLNPDGYAYNESTDPGGGGMWRKNRRANDDGSFGVDLNRNYGEHWGVDDLGSSSDPASEVYRGPAAFSEPEVQAVRDLCNAHAFRVALNYHAFGNLLIYPWGYASGLYTPDSAHFVQAALQYTHRNRYRFGTSDQTVHYAVNGGSDDWMYGEQGSKPKIMSCTAECGSSDDGFWPAMARIAPICRENLRTNLRAAELCGVMALAEDRAPAVLHAGAHARFSVKRLGLEPGPITVSIEPVMNVAAAGAPITMEGLGLLEERIDSIALVLEDGLLGGDPVAYDIVVSNGSFAWREPVRKIHGVEDVLLADDCSSMANWTGAGWGTTAQRFASAPASITDSPAGNYPPNANRTLTLAQPLSLAAAAAAKLTFRATWDLEERYDRVRVLGSSDGSQWTPLCGRHTRPGYAAQGPDDPVYDAQQPDWVREEIDLADFVGGPLRLRFELRSDPGLQYDGFYLDDVEVVATGLVSAAADAPAGGALIQAAPNPAAEELWITVGRTGAPEPLRIELFDALGALAAHANAMPGANRIDVRGLAPGAYACRLSGAAGPLGILRVAVAR